MTISNEVLALISQVAQKQVSANEELLSTGLIDSVSAMDLVMAIKQKFDVDLPFEQLVDILANSANIIQYVENNYKG
jgi:conserved domain protein